MKKYLKIGIISFLGLLLLFMGYELCTGISYKAEIQKKLQNIPQFSFQTLKGEEFSNKNLTKARSTIFIYFNSACGFCKHEATSIHENIELFKKVQLLWVSSENREFIDEFAKRYKLNKYENVIFLSDTKDDFTDRFDATSIPYVLVYNSDQELVRKHKGQLSVSSILDVLE
ncbi:TlpA family protein disulfide reductase [Aquimarina sp. M1]